MGVTQISFGSYSLVTDLLMWHPMPQFSAPHVVEGYAWNTAQIVSTGKNRWYKHRVRLYKMALDATESAGWKQGLMGLVSDTAQLLTLKMQDNLGGDKSVAVADAWLSGVPEMKDLEEFVDTFVFSGTLEFWSVNSGVVTAQ